MLATESLDVVAIKLVVRMGKATRVVPAHEISAISLAQKRCRFWHKEVAVNVMGDSTSLAV
jgi:hypothetical protein